MARNERVRAADGARTGDTLHDEIRDFASARPGGWDHDDWLTFLEHLRDRGHDTSDAAEIGSLLERERLAVKAAGLIEAAFVVGGLAFRNQRGGRFRICRERTGCDQPCAQQTESGCSDLA